MSTSLAFAGLFCWVLPDSSFVLAKHGVVQIVDPKADLGGGGGVGSTQAVVQAHQRNAISKIMYKE